MLWHPKLLSQFSVSKQKVFIQEFRRHDIKQNDTHHNDTQRSNKKCDTQQNGT